VMNQGMSINGMLELKIYGMSLSDMNGLSTVGLPRYGVRGDYISVSAGDDGATTHLVFDGTIFQAYIDFSASPDVAFVVSASPGLIDSATPSTPESLAGLYAVQDKLAALAKLMGLEFKNNNVNVHLRDQYLDGTNQDKVNKLVYASGICKEQTGSVLEIWQSGQARDSVVLDISADSGMIGYPSYTPTGMNVKTLFNPDTKLGRKVKLSSIVVKNNSEWFVNGVSHELTTLSPNGGWFTNINLGYADFVSKN
jgi:hypothetical protein